ncbi:MAG TPA: hypothetical protein VGO52_04700 [Hyphomonadaceae bacterium]|nr:hypothetical protein [Hyphomonadaceae bacterium]
MRILVVVVLALVALGAGGVWALGQFGDHFTSVASEPREPVVLEPQVTLAVNEPAAAPAATPAPAPSKPVATKPAAKPAAPKSELAKSQPTPAPAQPAAPAAETQATPAPPPPPPADAPAVTPATPAAPAKPNPLKPNSLNSSKPADVFSQLLPGSKPAAPPAPAPAAEAPAASAPAVSTDAAPAAPTQPAPPTATTRSAPAPSAQAPSAQAKAADPIVQPQQVQAPAAANVAAAATGLQAQLKSRAITYNRPPAKMALNKVMDVTLVINATEDADAGKEALQGSKGEIVERSVDLSDVVSAQLTALNGGFKITPLTVERQKLSGKIINRWQWSVEPIEVGTHTLILDIFGYESGSPDAEQLAAYRDPITVEVQQLDQVIGWAKGVQPLFAVLAALAGITSASVAFMRFRDERKAKKAAKSS